MKKIIIMVVIVGSVNVYTEDFKFKVNKDLNIPVPQIENNILSGEKAIFGENSMLDYYQAPEDLKKLADSTVAFVSKDLLEYDPVSKKYKIKKEIKVSANYIDEKEDFVNQNIISFCSGAYVGNSYILSAGHCVDEKSYKNVYVIFGWRYNSSNTSSP